MRNVAILGFAFDADPVTVQTIASHNVEPEPAKQSNQIARIAARQHQTLHEPEWLLGGVLAVNALAFRR